MINNQINAWFKFWSTEPDGGVENSVLPYKKKSQILKEDFLEEAWDELEKNIWSTAKFLHEVSYFKEGT